MIFLQDLHQKPCARFRILKVDEMITVNADFKKIVQQDSDILIDNRAQHNRGNPVHQNDAGNI